MQEQDFQTLVLEMFRNLQGEIRDLKDDMNRRFEQVDKRFEQVDKRFEQLEKRFDRLEDEIRADRTKLNAVYEARDKVKISFGWSWGALSLLLAIVAAGITQLFA